MSKRLLFVSKSFNPHFNLAYENWLIQDAYKSPNSPDCLFVYRNSPSIIIGRNQNTWAECNVSEAKTQGIPILRRYSGGGTVYNDLGNVNYSLHRDKSLFNRTAAAEMIIKSLKRHLSNPDSLYLSSRHDIFIKLQNDSTAKVSGSAYKLSRDRAYHHGTLLLSADLDKIGALLKTQMIILKDDKFEGVSSVPSPVTNLPDSISFETFLESITKEFKPTEPLIEISESNPRIEEYKKELESWDWTFGRSPPFKTKSKDGFDLIVESGIISKCCDYPSLIGTKFLTGMKVLPPGNLSSLQMILTISAPGTEHKLANVCQNIFALPLYPTEEIAFEKLNSLMRLIESGEAFEFGHV